jgi:hypothetical protein
VRPQAAPAAGTGANYQKKIIPWAPATVARNPRIAVRDKIVCAHPRHNGETSQSRIAPPLSAFSYARSAVYRQVKIGPRLLAAGVWCGHNENTNGAAGA